MNPVDAKTERNYKIVFTLERGDTKNIYTIKSDGTDLKQLTKSTIEKFLEPSYSPDGKRIVFCGIKGNASSIYVMDFDGSNQRKICSVPNCGAPVWSPDGQAIVFFGSSQNWLSLFVTDINGSNLCSLKIDRHASYPSFTPDSKFILFHSYVSGGDNWDIWKYDIANRTTMKLTESPNKEWHPVSSPAGKIAYWKCGRDWKWQLRMMEMDGTSDVPIGEPKRWITRHGEQWISRPCWTSSGSLVVSAPNKEGTSLDLMSVDIETKQFTTISSASGDAEDPSCSQPSAN